MLPRVDRAVKYVALRLEEPVVDPRTPVLIGAGQISNRVDRGADVLEPVDLIVEALRRAADDTGVGDAGAHRRRCRAHRRAPLLALPRSRRPRRRAGGRRPRAAPSVTGMGGNGPQSLVNLTCLAIQRGESDLVLLGGAEAWRTRMSARSAGVELDWTVQDESVPEAPRSIPEVPMSSPGEQARGVMMPVQVYPLFEQAHRDRARSGPRRAPRRRCRSCGPASARWRRPTRTRGSRRPTPPRRSARRRPTTG